jgi:hypothetical protein
MAFSVTYMVIFVIGVISLVFGVLLIFDVYSIRNVVPEYPAGEEAEYFSILLEPESSQQGTEFLLIVESNMFQSQDLRLLIEGKSYSKEIILYDDGKHSDGVSGDGKFGGVFSSVNVPVGSYDVKDGSIYLTTLSVFEPECELLAGDPNEENINFVILPSGYDNYEEFKKDARKLVGEKNSVLNREPFKTNGNEFSFSLVNTKKDLECEIDCLGIDSAVCCSNEIVIEEASQCHFDSVIVLLNDNRFCASSSGYAKVCAKDSLAGGALAHEIGHTFGGLADEYVYKDAFGDYEIPEDYISRVNCDSECNRWKEYTDECYEGCTSSSFYRSSETSLMRSVNEDEFNEVSRNHMTELIFNHGISERENVELGARSYFVDLSYSDGKFEIGDIYTKQVKAGFLVKRSDYSVSIKNEKGEELYRKNIDVPLVEFPVGDFSKVPLVHESIDTSFLVPYFEQGFSLEFIKDEEVLADASLIRFAETCGNNICDGAESHLSCPSDCSIDDGFCQSVGDDPDCGLVKKTKDGIGIYMAILFLVVAVGLISFVSFKVFYGKKE